MLFVSHNLVLIIKPCQILQSRDYQTTINPNLFLNFKQRSSNTNQLEI